MTIDEINALDRLAFVDALGGVFEHSPWVAERAWDRRPFASASELHDVMVDEVAHASRAEQLDLLRAHPDLGTRARMSAASSGEQAGAGLDRLPPALYERLLRLNGTYRSRFGFPFILAVRGATTDEVLSAIARRVDASPEDERTEALAQVARIARNRLNDIVQ
ncbi:MAG TPA: 2-oxo-4-hydroxy-4-carboxy-5-ureidoimidazoline decarboxylase [Vicinamibacterales bacterium]|nr:2-oxo-4-hydroxy-4-carboxy-5-ureidoimidazoline decarboxylase [Vicinamibacterales bacterium]